MVLSLEVGGASIGTGGQMSRQRAVIRLDELAFGALEGVESCGLGVRF